MYRCEDCGRFFDEPIVERDDPSPRGVSLPSGYYTYWHCPYCDSEEIEEAGVCKSCGEPVESGRTLCDTCRDDLASILKETAEEFELTQDMFEDALFEIFGW